RYQLNAVDIAASTSIHAVVANVRQGLSVKHSNVIHLEHKYRVADDFGTEKVSEFTWSVAPPTQLTDQRAFGRDDPNGQLRPIRQVHHPVFANADMADPVEDDGAGYLHSSYPQVFDESDCRCRSWNE